MARSTKPNRMLQQTAPGRYAAGPFTAERRTYMDKYGRATGYEVTVALGLFTITLSDPWSIEGPKARTIDEADALVQRYTSLMARAVMYGEGQVWMPRDQREALMQSEEVAA